MNTEVHERNRAATVALLLLIVTIGGCGTPRRTAADGSTPIPLEWRGAGFPDGAVVDPNEVIDFESLYVLHKDEYTGFTRFWSSGHVLARLISEPRGRVELRPEHGAVVDEQLRMAPEGGRYDGAIIGQWRVHEGDIYIEWFAYGPEMLDYVTETGPLTDDGFVLERNYLLRGGFRRWGDIEPPLQYEQEHVGPMEGEPTW